jgi:hypothetical protein
VYHHVDIGPGRSSWAVLGEEDLPFAWVEGGTAVSTVICTCPAAAFALPVVGSVGR